MTIDIEKRVREICESGGYEVVGISDHGEATDGEDEPGRILRVNLKEKPLDVERAIGRLENMGFSPSTAWHQGHHPPDGLARASEAWELLKTEARRAVAPPVEVETEPRVIVRPVRAEKPEDMGDPSSVRSMIFRSIAKNLVDDIVTWQGCSSDDGLHDWLPSFDGKSLYCFNCHIAAKVEFKVVPQ